LICLGIDQSLSNTGVVILDGSNFTVLFKDRFGTKPNEYLVKRIKYLSERVGEIVTSYNPDIVSIESTSYGSFASETLQALYQFMLNELWYREKLVCSPAPRQVHKFMQEWARSNSIQYPQKLKKKDIVCLANSASDVKFRQDEADAYWIARIGIAFMQAFNGESITDLFSKEMLSSEKVVKDHKKGMIFNEGQAFYDFRGESYPYRP